MDWRKRLGFMAFTGTLFLALPGAGKEELPFSFYTVLPGDSLEDIAGTLGVSVDDLLIWNGEQVGELFIGSQVAYRGADQGHLRSKGTIVIREGDSLASLSRQFEISVDALRALNPEGGFEEGEPVVGSQLQVLAPVRSRRHGVDRQGETFYSKIRDPEWLGEVGAGFIVKNHRNVWGSRETIGLLRDSFHRFSILFPESAPIVVGDISRKRGGKFHPHLSHRNGLDIDLGYAFIDNQERERFEVATRTTIDAEKSWALMRAFLESGHTEYIFVDYKLQRPLYEQARSEGLDETALEEIFQYPRSRGAKKGIIRHTRGHANHMHVRFGFEKVHLSTETLGQLLNSGENPIVQLHNWVTELFA